MEPNRDSRIEKYLFVIHDIAKNLLRLSNEEEYESGITEALRSLYEVIGDVGITSLWRYTPGVSGKYGELERLYSYFGDAIADKSVIQGAWPESWSETLQQGISLVMHPEEQPEEISKLFPPGIQTVLIVPIIIHDEFWGFIVMTNRKKFQIPDDDISFISACGLLVVERIIEHDLQKNLNVAQEEVGNANAAKSNFLFSMSHEMRTPLNAIIGMSNIARTTTDPERFARCFDIIDRSSRHLLSLINNVLDMSNIEVGKVELCYEPFNLNELLLGLEDILSIRAADMSQILRFNLDEGLRSMYIGDADKLSQIIINLIGNAIKFTPKGGEVVFVVKPADEKAKDPDKGRLRFEVTDSGGGIPDEKREILFKAFDYQGQDVAKKFGGTGLGLAISKGLIDKMGGILDFVSIPGIGSTFYFEVDLGLLNEEGERERVSEDIVDDGEYVDIRGNKLLLVEDIEINREVFIALLEDRNLEIDQAVNGLEAVEMYSADPEKYDIIVMDVQMPVMDGYEATEKIRASGLPRAKTIPIVALTANTLPEDIEHGMKSGMDAYVAKPIDFRLMLKTFYRYAGGNR